MSSYPNAANMFSNVVPVVQTLVSGDKTCDASKLRTPSSLHARFPSFPLHLFSEGDAHLDLSMWSIENMRCALRWSWIFSESVGLGSVESRQVVRVVLGGWAVTYT